MGPDTHALKRMQSEIAGKALDRLAAIELRQRLMDHIHQLVTKRADIGREIEGARLRRRAFTAYKEFKQ